MRARRWIARGSEDAGGVLTPRSLLLVLAAITVIAMMWASPATVPPPTWADPRGGVPRVVAAVLPAVVSIATRELDEDPLDGVGPTRDLGSGFVVDRRGFIVTNSHVVEGAVEITVTLADGRAFPARLVGADPATDLAVLAIDGRALPTIPLGDSRRVRIGEPVVAIGNPLGIEGGPTVTVGVVSGLGRSMEEPGLPTLHRMVQTDAAINPGSSGGPLVSLDGRVVGINTALVPSAHGIGFAIAMDIARPIVQELITAGRVARPSLGLTAVSVTAAIADANGLPISRGALVRQVEDGGPAATAGIRPGDLITGLGGAPVADLHDVHERLWRRRAGASVDVTLWRAGTVLAVRAIPRNE